MFGAGSLGWRWGYFVDSLELRRALTRARAEAKNAPAEPTTARIAVGFSGESAQPLVPCAWSGWATKSRRAKARNRNEDFFIDGSPSGKVLARILICQYEKLFLGRTS